MAFFATCLSQAQNETDIPPPPMPEYMKKQRVEMPVQQSAEQSLDQEEVSPVRHLASESSSFDEQSEESIREEFLNAAEDEIDHNAKLEQDPIEQPIEDPLSAPVMDKPAAVLEEAPGAEPLQEVSEVEVAVPEFEEVDRDSATEEAASNQYIPGSGSELQHEVAEENNTNANLEEVEEKLEESENLAEQTLIDGRKPTGDTAFKSGMYKFSDNCTMYKEPRSFSDEAGTIAAGRKLWIDPHKGNWLKAYKKSGRVYISADCLK